MLMLLLRPHVVFSMAVAELPNKSGFGPLKFGKSEQEPIQPMFPEKSGTGELKKCCRYSYANDTNIQQEEGVYRRE
jgi:hypothetical protein